jgi:vesicle coat complex subunit
MSSVRVRIIAPLVGMAVKEKAGDSSPYVRKIAALAIQKVTVCAKLKCQFNLLTSMFL